MADEKKSCCDMRKKVVVGIYHVLSKSECGLGDEVMADYHEFDYQSPAGVPVGAALKFRFCPWCGTKRDDNQERRVTEVILERPSPTEDEGEQWKTGGQDEAPT